MLEATGETKSDLAYRKGKRLGAMRWTDGRLFSRLTKLNITFQPKENASFQKRSSRRPRENSNLYFVFSLA